MGSGEHSLPQPLSVADELAQFKSRWLTKHSNMTFAGEQSRTEIRSGAEWKMHTVPAVPQHDGVRAASEAMFRQCISWPEKKKLKSKFSSVKSCRSYILFISFSGWRQQSLQLQVKSCPAPLLSVAQHTSPAHPSPAGICFVLVLEPSLSLSLTQRPKQRLRNSVLTFSREHAYVQWVRDEGVPAPTRNPHWVTSTFLTLRHVPQSHDLPFALAHSRNAKQETTNTKAHIWRDASWTPSLLHHREQPQPPGQREVCSAETEEKEEEPPGQVCPQPALGHWEPRGGRRWWWWNRWQPTAAAATVGAARAGGSRGKFLR